MLIGLAALISSTIFVAWRLPSLAALLPDGWAQMQATTALTVLLLCVGMAFGRQKKIAHAAQLRWSLAAIAIVFPGIALVEHITGIKPELHTLLVADELATIAQVMSMQSVVYLSLLSLVVMADRTKQFLIGGLADVVLIVMALMVLVLFAGYLYNASGFYEHAPGVKISIQTLIFVSALSLVQGIRRNPFGLFGVVTGIGIGSRISRAALPTSLLVSYLIILGGERLLASGGCRCRMRQR